jgi:microcystin-dependent protein
MTDSTLSEVFSESVNKAVSEAVSKAVSQTLQTIYPVGAYYISESATNPATLFGFGTWELLTDRTLMGAGSTYSVGAQGGEATHTLTVAEMPSHTHSIALSTDNSGNWAANRPSSVIWADGDHDPARNLPVGKLREAGVSGTFGDRAVSEYFASAFIQATGDSSAHNNLPPYRAVYIFRRTA